MADLEHSPDAAQRQFAVLGFRLVRRFLGLVMVSCGLLILGGLALGWVLEGDVTVRAEGVVRPRSRHVIKAAVEGVVQNVEVHGGERVAEGDILVVLSPRDTRARLEQIEDELTLSLSRQANLRSQLHHEQRVLEAVVEARRIDVGRAAAGLTRVRDEQRGYSERALPGWKRQPLEDLVPVREAAVMLAQTQAQLEVARRQLRASRARAQEVELEALRWASLDQERQALWRRLEGTVLRAPVDGVVLTRDLDLREGDRVQVGEALLELAQDDAWVARVQVRQLDRPKLRPGQEARVFVRAYPALRHGAIAGALTDIAGQAAGAAGFYPADIELQDSGLVLADGMVAEARIAVDRGPIWWLAWRRILGELGPSPLPELRRVRG